MTLAKSATYTPSDSLYLHLIKRSWTVRGTLTPLYYMLSALIAAFRPGLSIQNVLCPKSQSSSLLDFLSSLVSRAP